MLYGINVRYKCMQVLTYIQVLFNATATTKLLSLDLRLLNADTDVSTVSEVGGSLLSRMVKTMVKQMVDERFVEL